MTLPDLLPDHDLVLRLASTVLVVIVVGLARGATIRLIRKRTDINDLQKRRQVFYARSSFNLALALGLLLIWLGQVQNLVLSLTAVIVAVVVATKELLMCISGFALRTGASSFSVGDWIEVNGIRGEVTEFDLLSTTLLELHPPRRGHTYTGNRIVLPNSLFLGHPVRNEKLSRPFVLHPVSITVEPPPDVAGVLGWLDAEARRLCAPFADEALAFSRAIDQRLGADMPGPEPVVSVQTTDTAKLSFQVLLLCPTTRAQGLERELVGGLLDHLSASRPPVGD